MTRFFDTHMNQERMDLQRRDFLRYGLAGIVGLSVPSLLCGEVQARSSAAWKVSFRHAHTGESFSGVYRVGDKYLPEAFERLNYVMRDFRTKEVFPMDPHVIDIIAMVQKKARSNEPLNVLSAYRSPKTNAMLGKKSNAVASNSFHMYGQAVDIRMPDFSTKQLRNIAKSLSAGGVGYYPRSSFIHVDTGDVRSWVS